MEKTTKKDDVPNVSSNYRLSRRIGKNNDRSKRRNRILDLESGKNRTINSRRSGCEINSSVTFISNKLKVGFEHLKQGKFEDKQLYKFIDRAIDDLKQNPHCGIKIPQKLWPRVYIKNYQVSNLWKYDLPNSWRLIYTIEQTEVVIVSIILEWFSHNEYSRRFKY